MKKRFISLTLVLALILTLFPMTALADDPPALTDGVWEYTVNDDGETATLVGYTGTGETEVTTPETVEGLTVTAIGANAFSGNNEITRLFVYWSVSTIEANAFSGLTSLESIYLPGVESISTDGTFTNDTNLKAFIVFNDFCKYGNMDEAGEDDAVEDMFVGLDNVKLYGNPGSTTQAYADAVGKDFRVLTNYMELEKNYCKIAVGSTFKADFRVKEPSDGFVEWSSDNTDVATVDQEGNITGQNIGHAVIIAKCLDYEIRFDANIIGPTLTYGDWDYYVNADGNATLLSYKGTAAAVETPEQVTSDASTYYDVTRIGSDAFANNTSIESVQISEGVTQIGDEIRDAADDQLWSGAFLGCTSLTTLTLPTSLERLGKQSFVNCPITTINVDGNTHFWTGEGADENVLFSGDAERPVLELYYQQSSGAEDDGKYTIPNDVEILADRAFGGNERLKELIVPSSVVEMTWAISYVPNLEKIVFEDGIEKVEGCCFCDKLNNVDIPSSVKVIEANAFKQCTALTTVTLHEGLDYIGGDAFAQSGLTTIEIPNSVGTIEGNAFNQCDQLGSVIFDEGDAKCYIGGSAFSNCSGLTSVTMNGTVEDMGAEVFGNCTNLASVTFNEGLKYIGDKGFSNSKLTSVTIPSTVINIGADAFRNCKSLTSVLFAGESSSLQYLGSYAFSDCTLLTGEMTLPDGVEFISDGVLSNSKLTALTIPDSVTGFGSYALSNCPQLERITFSEYSKMGYIGQYACYKSGLTEIVIPKGVDNIDSYAFSECPALASVDFTENEALQYLGDGVFSKCGLESVYIPGTLDYVTQDSFSDCPNLNTVTLNEGLKGIGDRAFSKSGVEVIVIPGTVDYIGQEAFSECAALESATLNEGVHGIGDRAFSKSGLKQVNMPASLQGIGTDAFSNCDKLKKIYIAEGNTHYANIWHEGVPDGVLYEYYTNDEGETETSLVMFPMGWESDSFTVPEGVTGISGSPYGAFHNAGLSSMTLTGGDNGVVWIQGDYALAGNNFTRLEIPRSTVLIREGGHIFADNPKLIELVFRNENTILEWDDEKTWFENTPNVTIYGDSGSTAQQLAVAYDIPFSIIPESLELTEDGLTAISQTHITRGETKTLSVLPTGALVKWSSDDTTVATVDEDGKVTAIKAGTAHISAACLDETATCDVTVDPIQYTIAASANNASYGSVSGLSDEGIYAEGAEVTFTATPKDHFRFVRWTLDGSEVTENVSYTFTVSGDASYIAEFEPIPYTVTAEPDDETHGTVTISGGPYYFGSEVTLNADAEEGYRFVKWTNGTDTVSTDASCKIEVPGDAAYIAVFEKVYTVTVLVNDDALGSVTGLADDGIYAENADVTLIAEPKDENYSRFVHWMSGSTVLSSNSSYTFKVTGKTDIEAVFEKIPYEIELSANDAAYGTVSGGGTYYFNDEVTLTATPNEGYGFIAWKTGSTVVSTDASYMFTVTSPAALTAYFGAKVTITATANDDDYGSVTGGGVCIAGTDVTLTATPEAGYRFVRWTEGEGGPTVTGAAASYTFNVGTARTLIAEFEEIPVASVSLNPSSATLKVDGTTKLTATVLPSDVLNKTVTWSSSDASVASVDASGNVTAKKVGTATITANCQGKKATCDISVVPKTFNVIAVPNNTGYGSVSGGGPYANGASATLTAAPVSGYRFVRWTENGAEVSRSATYTVAATRDYALTAEFTALTPVGLVCTSMDATVYNGADGSVTISASGGNSGAFEYSINNGASWQPSNVFGGLAAGTYTAAVRDAGYTANVATANVAVGQPAYIGPVPANKVPTKAAVDTAITVTPPAAPKGYTTQSVTFTSSNPSVAAVDANGNVTFLAGGKVTIITKVVSQTVDKKGKVKIKTTMVKKTITVNQLVENIALNLGNATIARTQKVTLTANIAPGTASNKKLTWKSSNPKVAAVSGSGVVTGKAGGTAIITCIAKDGSGAAASCVVTVTPIYPAAVKLSKAALTVKLGKTASLKATITPKNTDFKTVTWTSSNQAVVTVDSKGKVKAIASGTAVITATTSNGITAACTITVQ